jgi:formyltetrahydrofolate deformylase
MDTYTLTLRCTDQPGIVKALATGIGDCGGNIVTSAQSFDEPTGTFCMRTEFETEEGDERAVRSAIDPEVARFDPVVTLRRSDQRRRFVIMVSRFDHCLRDLLYRWSIGELCVDIPVVVSNHEDCRALVESYGIPFEYLPVTPAGKPAAEARLLDVVEQHRADYVVLARYMQVLSDEACRALTGRVINIHHSFLPGFKGAKPYHQAYDRGVKLIGATAHFVTADLDEGPIIEQDVERVNHANSADQLVAIGRDVERMVLSRAVALVADDRVFLVGKRTIVFPR